METFLGISWNANDLIACKQAVGILLDKISSKDLLSLWEKGEINFGNLDVPGVIEEFSE